MKTNTTLLVLMLAAFLPVSFDSKAQQATSSTPITETSAPGNQLSPAYTFKVFQAPNKMYGYDIFMNNKIVLHQPAAFSKQDNSVLMLSDEQHAEKAATFVINKMKNSQPSALTRDEIRKLNGR